MALIDLITPEVIKVPLSATTKTGVLNELTELLMKAGRIEEAGPVLSALQERESLGSTGLEKGIAVPHCKITAVKTLTLAIGIAPAGIEYEAIDGQPSTLFFCMLAPPDQSGPHIEALSEIARLTQSQSFCRVLMGSQSADEVVELFRD
jgi:nitrogen PTS system EIIA component